MFNQKIKKGAALVAVMFIMTACGMPTNNLVPEQTNTNTSNTVISEPSNLKFNKVNESNLAEYNSLLTKGASNSVQANALGSSPSSVSASPMVAGGGAAVGVGDKMSPYMSYFPAIGPFEEYTVTDFEEAKTQGFSGTYLEALNKIVKPAIKGLGGDARLTNSNGSSNENGINKSNDPQINNNSEVANYPNYYQQYQWQFTYVSSAKKEVYSIFVSAKETLVLRQKWGIKDLSPEDIKIDSGAAIKIVTDAILNKNFNSPDSQQQYVSPDSETLYEIPKKSSWYLYLEKEKGKLIWNINMNITYDNPMPLYDSPVASNDVNTVTARPAPQQPEYWYSGGYARIDAATGSIITLTRPTRYRNNYPIYPVPPIAYEGSSGGQTDAVSPATAPNAK